MYFEIVSVSFGVLEISMLELSIGENSPKVGVFLSVEHDAHIFWPKVIIFYYFWNRNIAAAPRVN